MSIELFLAVNGIADFALLWMVSRTLGVFNWRRVLACDGLCVAYGLLAATLPSPWAAPALQAALLVGVSALLTHRAAPKARWTAALGLCAAASLCGGMSALLPLPGPVAMAFCVASGGTLISLIFAPRPLVAGSWQVRLCLSIGERTARFPALIDTGNRLREPLSGLPVLIAEAALLGDALPRDGYRVLPFGGVGGEGQMACFKPNSVWIEQGRKRRHAPEVWVAISPGPLPGMFQALAPPEFALYAK